MPEITEGVVFDTVAREWRLKWSDKECLAAVQKVAAEYFETLKATKGFKSLDRIVCGGCLDYKLITAVGADDFGAFEASGFGPEAEYLGRVKAVPGVTMVETQTYTLTSPLRRRRPSSSKDGVDSELALFPDDEREDGVGPEAEVV
eukprot:CAMPEP_0197414552 /NCGR_PEP_ID=MMETSP1170-20131217/1256_1 /TAXON_ID=54406 /ORGANISM="Sarcinochrysis sp, Strain CCMP770" /LENGTH=145 /DNA_ID=CAMNT_0042941275 /DNA_START=28 /DNA_END=460 /DNA_ORIENTATION=-